MVGALQDNGYIASNEDGNVDGICQAKKTHSDIDMYEFNFYSKTNEK